MLKFVNSAAVSLSLLWSGVGIAASPLDSETLERIDEVAQSAMTSPGTFGLSIAVGTGDEIVLARGYGKADLEHDVAMTDQSMLRIASITKQYTAAAILKLAEQDKLSLDDPISEYCDYPVGEHEVTIEHLLNHTSGIPSYTNVAEFWEAGATRDLSHEDLLAYVRDKPFDFSPGEQFAYNNTGYYLLGIIMEDVTGKPYAQAMDELLFEPLGLDQTRYDISTEIVPNRARGYTLTSDASPANALSLSMNNPGAAGGLMATASDLVRWQQALMNGRVISDQSLAAMKSPTQLPDDKLEQYGYGIVIGEMHDQQCFTHGGGLHGFSSMLMYFPEADLHIAVLANSDTAEVGQTAARIAGAALGVEEPEMLDLAVDDALMQQIVGTYVLERIGLVLELTSDGDRIIAQGQGQPQIQLLHQGDGVFRAAFDPTLRVTFPDLTGEAASEMTLKQRGQRFTGVRQEN